MSRESHAGEATTSRAITAGHTPSWQAMTQTPAVPPPSTPDPIALIAAFRRRWRLAISLGISLGLTTTIATLYLMPPAKYKAQALLQVATQPPRILIETREVQTDFKTYQKTQEAYIHSRMVLDAALGKEGVKDLKLVRKQPDPVEWLEKQIQVDFAFGSEILRIGITGEDPQALAVLVNAVTKSYMEEVVEAELKERRHRQQMIRMNWERYQEKLREKRAEVKRLGEVAGSNDSHALAVAHMSEQDRLARAESELARVQSELRSLTVDIALLEKRRELTATRYMPMAVEEQASANPVAASLADRVAKAKIEIQRLGRTARSKADIAHQQLNHELKAAENALRDHLSGARPAAEKKVANGLDSEARVKVELAQERFDILTRQETTLAEEVKRLAERARVITRTSVDLASIHEEIAAADEIAKKLAVEVEALNIELQAPARVRLIQKAEVPRETDKNRVVKVAGGAGLAMLALGIAGVCLWEFMSRRIHSIDDVESKMQIRVVGCLPEMADSRALQRVNGTEVEIRQRSHLMDSIDAARTAILHAARIGNLRVLMVASARNGEGKSTLACQLAASLARAGKKTLLIDFDLRKPSVHTRFDHAEAPGVCEILRGESTAADVAAPAATSDLWVIPAGLTDGRVFGAMARDEVRLLFEDARRHWSFVIVDSAPLLEVTDALQIGHHVDAAILSVKRDVSRGPDIYSSCRRLASLGIPLFGAVFSGIKLKSHGLYPNSSAEADESPATVLDIG